MARRTEVTITNGHRYAVHVAGRRFRPGRPRTLPLSTRQLKAVRGNPWLWIEGEDYEGEAQVGGDFSELNVEQLKALLHSVGQPVSGNKDELVERLESAREGPIEAIDEEE